MKTHEISILRLRAYRDKAFESGLYNIVESINDSIKLTSPEKLLQEKVDVPESLILEAHKEVCNEWKSRIEKDFPKAFPKDEYFNFGRGYHISTDPSHEEHPFTIGAAWCEFHDEKEFTSLFINRKYWEMESSECLTEGHRMIKLRFKKKKKNG